MSEDERAVISFGMTPLWTIEADLGGKDISGGWTKADGEYGKLLSLALMDLVEMVV